MSRAVDFLKKSAQTIGNIEKGAADAALDTFINPVAQAALTPIATVKSGIDSLVPGGRTGQESLKTPFGNVKPMMVGSNKKNPGALKPGEAAYGAFQLATSVPGVTGKLATGAAKAIPKIVGETAGKVVNPLLKKGGEFIARSAEKTFGEALNPTTAKLKAATDKITKRALDEGIWGTAKSITAKAKEGLKKAGEALDAFGELQGKSALSKIDEVMDAAKNEFIVNGVAINKHAINAIDEIKGTLGQLAGETGEVPREALRAVRRIWDDEVAAAGGFLGKTLKEGSDVAVKKTASDAIRNLLANEVDGLKTLNANYNFYKNLSDIIEATKLRRVGQSNALRKGAGAIAGAVIGGGLKFLPLGELLGAKAGEQLAVLGGSTLFKSFSAAGKAKVAKALLNGGYDLEKVAQMVENSAYTSLKINDFLRFLNKDAKLSEEKREQFKQEQDARVQELHDTLFGDEGDAAASQPPSPSQNNPELNDADLKAILGI